MRRSFASAGEIFLAPPRALLRASLSACSSSTRGPPAARSKEGQLRSFQNFHASSRSRKVPTLATKSAPLGGVAARILSARRRSASSGSFSDGGRGRPGPATRWRRMSTWSSTCWRKTGSRSCSRRSRLDVRYLHDRFALDASAASTSTSSPPLASALASAPASTLAPRGRMTCCDALRAFSNRAAAIRRSSTENECPSKACSTVSAHSRKSSSSSSPGAGPLTSALLKYDCRPQNCL
mmetsp:Transcript_28174/g.90058  ORF Transcript_28174/g.90058 Transcript_28174/m.90058 type:complete len:238 (-) Transcript_28174:1904-2617(-)